MSNGDPKKGEPGQQDVSKSAPAPGAGEPTKKPPEGEPGAKPPEGEPKDDFLSMKLDGDKVPEKIRGKTVLEALEVMKSTEGELSKAMTEISQWHRYYEVTKQKEEAGAAQTQEEQKKADILKVFEEDQVNAIVGIMNEFMRPVFDSVSGMQLAYVKSVRPDFERYEKRATEIYNNFPLMYKMDPRYGYDFAYRFAKSEAEGTAPPPAAPLPHSAASQTGVPPAKQVTELTDDQEFWRQRFGMSKEEYLKFKDVIDVDKFKES